MRQEKEIRDKAEYLQRVLDGTEIITVDVLSSEKRRAIIAGKIRILQWVLGAENDTIKKRMMVFSHLTLQDKIIQFLKFGPSTKSEILTNIGLSQSRSNYFRKVINSLLKEGDKIFILGSGRKNDPFIYSLKEVQIT